MLFSSLLLICSHALRALAAVRIQAIECLFLAQILQGTSNNEQPDPVIRRNNTYMQEEMNHRFSFLSGEILFDLITYSNNLNLEMLYLRIIDSF